MFWLPYSSHTSHHPSQTPCLPWISYATQNLLFDSCKMLQKQSEAFHTFLWHFLHIVLLRYPHVQTVFFKFTRTIRISRVYSNCWCRCSFEAENIKIGQSYHKMYSNNILNFQESPIILNACTKKASKIIECTTCNRTTKWCTH